MAVVWPTPRANSGTGACDHGDGGQDLQTAVAWATPMASEGQRGVGKADANRDSPRLTTEVRIEAQSFSGQLNPRLGRVLDGVSHRLDQVKWPAWRGQEQYDWEPPRTAKNIPERPRRIESLGLSVCPYQALPLMSLIKEMDDIVREQSL